MKIWHSTSIDISFNKKYIWNSSFQWSPLIKFCLCHWFLSVLFSSAKEEYFFCFGRRENPLGPPHHKAAKSNGSDDEEAARKQSSTAGKWHLCLLPLFSNPTVHSGPHGHNSCSGIEWVWGMRWSGSCCQLITQIKFRHNNWIKVHCTSVELRPVNENTQNRVHSSELISYAFNNYDLGIL